jgi:capsule polysaccharide export protein KpsE/RkpR
MATAIETDHTSLTDDANDPLWVVRAWLLWRRRVFLARVAGIALVVSLAIAFIIPKQYKSSARMMPPQQQNAGAMVLAAMAARGGGLGTLGSLAGGLLSDHSTTALLVDLLRSGTVTGHLVDRFDLQKLYHRRYRSDAAKKLVRRTKVTDDRKSGVITLEVTDTSPTRARDMAQAYLDELNKLVITTSTSAARRERVFIEQRLVSVEKDLEKAQVNLSEFSSKNSTIDIKEQTRATVDAGARLEGEMLVSQAELGSLRQIYGDSNVRVRETEARVATLKRELEHMAGSSSPAATDAGNELSPQLRQLPRLAVPYADLYRKVRTQEAVFDLLTQQYELARIEEAKDIPIVSVIDAPGVPEKKSFPPRLLLALLLTLLSVAAAAAWVLMTDAWDKLSVHDPRRVLGNEMWTTMRGALRRKQGVL